MKSLLYSVLFLSTSISLATLAQPASLPSTPQKNCAGAIASLSQIEAPLMTPFHRMHNPVKEALASGQVVYGNIQKGHDIPSAKDLATGGHFIWMNAGEKPGEFTAAALEPLVSATHQTKPAIIIVQLESFNSPQIKPIIGLGVLGLAAPGIKTADQANRFLGSIKFPSAGFLGLGPDDTTAFLSDVAGASRFGNQARMAIVIVDSHEAASSDANIRSIIGAQLTDKKGNREGFDAVLADRKKLSALEVARVERVARELKIVLIGDVTNRGEALQAAQLGYRMFRYGSDLDHIRVAAQTYLASGTPNVDVEAQPVKLKNEKLNPLYTAIKDNKLAVGFYSMGHDPLQAVQGTKAGTGKTFIWADGEHRPLDRNKLSALIKTVSSQTPAVVIARVPHQLGADADAETKVINDYVKLGVKGLVQPNVSTPGEAQTFIDAVEAAAQKNGKPIEAVMKSVMIETKEGLANLDQILDTVEKHRETMWIHVGPFDLLNSLKAIYGETLTFDSPEFKAAIATIETKTRARGIALGGLAMSRKQAQEKYAQGYRVLTVGSDQESINAGINQFLATSPGDASRVQRERLTSTLQQAASLPWRPIANGRLKQINDPENHNTLNYVEISGPITEGPFAHQHIQKQTTYIIEGQYHVVIGEPGNPEYKTFDMGPGDAITIPAGIRHEFTRLSEKAALIDVLASGRVR